MPILRWKTDRGDTLATLLVVSVALLPVLYHFGLLDPCSAWAVHASGRHRTHPTMHASVENAEDLDATIRSAFVTDWVSDKPLRRYGKIDIRRWSVAVLGVEPYASDRTGVGVLLVAARKLNSLGYAPILAPEGKSYCEEVGLELVHGWNCRIDEGYVPTHLRRGCFNSLPRLTAIDQWNLLQREQFLEPETSPRRPFFQL
ncbi:hypothetical protein [Stratiformator vulcanicus]|nr:hypothetical protein [Stratiformator vulcanicus]